MSSVELPLSVVRHHRWATPHAGIPGPATRVVRLGALANSLIWNEVSERCIQFRWRSVCCRPSNQIGSGRIFVVAGVVTKLDEVKDCLLPDVVVFLSCQHSFGLPVNNEGRRYDGGMPEERAMVSRDKFPDVLVREHSFPGSSACVPLGTAICRQRPDGGYPTRASATGPALPSHVAPSKRQPESHRVATASRHCVVQHWPRVPDSTMASARARSSSAIVSGGESVRTLPALTLNDTPSARQA